MLIKINKKKVLSTVIALVFCFVCACMPFQIKKVRAMSVGVAMAATSILVSLYCIGMHADSSGTTNFEHVANAIRDQYRADFVEKNYTNIATGEAETRFEQLTNMWQEGIVDINSNAWASFKQWAFDTYCGAIGGVPESVVKRYGDGYILPFSAYFKSSETCLQLSDGEIINSSSSGYSGVYFSIDPSVSNRIYSSNFIINSNNKFYFISCGNPDKSFIYFSYSNFSSGGSGSGSYSPTRYKGLSYCDITSIFNSSLVCQNLNIESTNLSVQNYIDQIVSYSVPSSPSSSAPFTLSLDDNEVYNQVKQIADAEIAGNTTEQLLRRARYLNDMIGQKPKDGSQYINTLDGTKQFDGSAEDTGQAIIDGTISVPDLLQDVGVDTTVQGQVVSDPVTGEAVPELATPVDLSSSVPLVVNPTLEVVFPQTYNPPTSKGGDFSFPLVNYFPFCMPYDAIRILGLFRAAPEAPSISFNINSYFANIVNFANKDIGEDGDLVKVRGNVMTLDFSPFNTVAAICRFMLYVLFLVGVCFGISNWLHGGE